MAILKSVELENGVTVNYHRIVSVNNITNKTSVIEIGSYTNETKRNEEKEALKNSTPMNVFINSKYLNLPYDSEMNIVKAYNYLKTTDEYKGSEDI